MLLSQLCLRTGATEGEIKLYESLNLFPSTLKQIGSKLICDYDEEIIFTIKELKKGNNFVFKSSEFKKILGELTSSDFSNSEFITLITVKLKKIDKKIAGLKECEHEIIKKLSE
jgi:hypothetical protein